MAHREGNRDVIRDWERRGATRRENKSRGAFFVLGSRGCIQGCARKGENRSGRSRDAFRTGVVRDPLRDWTTFVFAWFPRLAVKDKTVSANLTHRSLFTRRNMTWSNRETLADRHVDLLQ